MAAELCASSAGALSSSISVHHSPKPNLPTLHFLTLPSSIPHKSIIPFPLCRLRSDFIPPIRHKTRSSPLSAVPEAAGTEKTEESNQPPPDGNHKRKLYVVNLPPFVSGPYVTKMLQPCGRVQEVEIIKEKNGKSRGYAFVTMATAAQAQAVIDKFHSQTLAGRTIRIQYAKQFKKPAPRKVNPPPPPLPKETRYKLYVSNLYWKVRANHLRECFAAVSNPASTRVVFNGTRGSSVGYGFVGFKTREEAEAARTALNGQELMGRPLCLEFSEKNVEEEQHAEKDNEETLQEEQSEESSVSGADISNFLLERNILLTDMAD